MGEERPPTQIIMAKVIKASKQLKEAFFIRVHGLLTPKVGFERSALDERKTTFLKLRSRGFPSGVFGRQDRQSSRSRKQDNKRVITTP